MGPVILLVVNEEPEISFYPLVVPFRLSIGTGVVGGRDVLGNTEDPADFLGKFRREARVPITDNLPRESILAEYILDEEPGRFFCRDSLIAGYEQRRFSTVVISDCED